MTTYAPNVSPNPYSAYQQMGGYNYGFPQNQFLSPNTVFRQPAPAAQPLYVNQPQQGGGFGGIDFPGSQFLSGNLSKPFFNPMSGSKINSAIGSGIDSIGQQFGFTGAEVFGPNLPGVASSNAGLSTAFNPANAIGSFAGNFLGNSLLGSDRGIGADIGGTIGGIAGGVAASTALGQALIPIPGVGAVIGALAGNALGGLFGGSEPNPFATWNNYDENNKSLYNPDGTLKGAPDLQSKHIGGDFGQQMGDRVVGVNQALHQIAGIDMSSVLNITGYEKNYGGFIALNSPFQRNHEMYNPDNVFYFDEKNPEDQQRALVDYSRRMLEMHRPDLGADAINQMANQVVQSQNSQQQGNFQGTLGMPMIPQKSGVGNESYANFMKRYREEGATTPQMGRNTPFDPQGAPVIPV